MSKKAPDWLKAAQKARSMLPGIYGAMGKIEESVKHCKPHSQKWEGYWAAHTDLTNKAQKLEGDVLAALIEALSLYSEKQSAPKITPKLETLIIRAVKAFGSYDPDQIMVLFEEDLNDQEYTLCSAFLRWVMVNGRKFGSGNIHTVFAECEQAIGSL